MTLQQLKYAIEIAHCGSINEAAKRLFITQPSLSSAIKELETELGVTIFIRTNRGIVLSTEGTEFLGYARQVTEQMNLLEERYLKNKPARRQFSVSTQHYAFAVSAFVALLRHQGLTAYDCMLSETRTYEIIADVKNLRSEIGILYLNPFNAKVLHKLFNENDLAFHPLFDASPHVFLSAQNPLANKPFVTLEDLEDLPCLSFEQGEYNSFHFSEEILSTLSHRKNIRVSDRATIFNCLIGLDGYTISTGILSAELNGTDIVSVPLQVDEHMTVGWIAHRKLTLSPLASCYLEELKAILDREHPSR
ncbi:LysR family transcriptional regulator [Ethanoligenens harbinense]|uniref:Transcriptional regulator, LysR family n=1 Tax=Ethanoligenens harbinense (strain DSM 18485 / JCM 12961 / CGMCC 1.5033 / YUAN-3) TaxID=663278 RepID=E6U2Y1_ETHHY|nr:LysR family transcriptional regulator [Ethanoligenens harbinense]ADU26348.1 transcriptional regulator, LysR family [Ethanoligenens harbinense YUAN-3]AVQ95479.1 LysR family transcriptional regulator [Ethanoligenens harbinense YUAN-3]AYF38144.1 LysR family transcriptional regulator [Ethanoligenens harbinense]AYF40889.1 LysR family transcriptional regulator [Ethanoligenens harbinense]QCN91720.1 LysR family transcriptional regulator [Ethanoligenens harbinense]